ncbi:MAG TPA: corrinoid protein [Candidatus Marinimicrobia bacterium]|jgi:corrinoid protein of di/trimethylamine methyltransferase|nr:corrinoid protein [Candidatus Neomarinimicrobiota bacterium]MDP7120727.1 corrinoid protein [Candidatus Neomarinimicrobiota bacterium]MDP7483224.1 corrinoid protein [Candidatus Neomarinimicrobiota bacterium]MDP7528034.1 corrinoid protein [Candidatus Neomarinimicrobiota bacterium]MDP7716542.1 corrinoid protein [Candidatus Neomarinimicrobiota bacterium]|tara:strand:- start:531 stop:1175 length:645 start_codon:yes stop_codon:yes gene_type:complete
MDYLEKLHDAIINGDPATAISITERALAENIDPHVLINDYMIRAMDEVGRRFERFEFFIPQLLMSAKAMKGAMALIKPLLVGDGVLDDTFCAITGTVKGDVHDIGKNLLGALLEGGGFRVVDLGTNVSPEQFIEAVQKHEAKLVCMSALLTTTMPGMKTTIDAFKEAEIRDRVIMLVGGAPVTQHFAEDIGADGYRDNASAGVVLAKELLGVGK